MKSSASSYGYQNKTFEVRAEITTNWLLAEQIADSATLITVNKN